MSKELEAVQILWIDAHGGEVSAGGWGDLSRSELKPRAIRTVGMLTMQNDDAVVVALSHDGKNNYFDSYISIPRAFIQSISHLH